MTSLNIVIIGATSDMAVAAARAWAAEGCRFLLVGRVLPHLQQVAEDLRVRGAAEVACEVLDIVERDRHAIVMERAWKLMPRVDLMLLAAGTLPDQKACEDSPALCHEPLEINFTAVAELLLHAARHFEAQNSGVIAIIGSVAGDRGRCGNYIYGAAKAGLAAFASGLRVRLRAANVRVLLIKPGFVATRMTAGMRQGLLFTSAEKAGGLIVRATASHASTVYVPSWWRLIMGIICLIPEFVFKRLKL